MHKTAIAALICLCTCAATAQAQDEFRAGLSLRAGFGGRADQNWTPHLLASFGSGPQFVQQSRRSAESQCLLTAGDMGISGATAASSACDAAPLVQLDLGGGGLSSANLLGLNLMKVPRLFSGNRRDLLSGNSDWVQWTLKQHGGDGLAPGGSAALSAAMGAR